jgi:multidrug resistance efflux pump
MSPNGTARSIRSRSRWVQAIEARVEGQVVEVTPSMYGRVERVLIEEGRLVAKGEILVELDHRQLDRNLAVAREALADEADRLRARGRYLIARLNRSSAEVRAPVAGRVLVCGVRQGEYPALAQTLVSILESDDLWVLARFSARDFGRVRVGQTATVSAGGRWFAARVAGLAGPDEPALLDFVVPPETALRPGLVATAVVAAD